MVNFSSLKFDVCSTHGECWWVLKWECPGFDEQTYFDMLADLEVHFRVEQPIVAFLQFIPGKCSIAFWGKGYGTLSCDEIYVAREYLRQQHVQLSTIRVLPLSSSQFWYGPEIYQNTSKRRIDNSVGWVARWNKSCCRARIFWLLRRMQPINVVQIYSIDHDISSKMSVFTGNLDIISHVFFIHNNKPTLQVQHKYTEYLNGKIVGMVPISNILFLRNSANLPICQKLPPRLAHLVVPAVKKTWRWDPDVVEIYPSQSLNRMGNACVWYCMIFVGLILNTDVGRILYIFLFDIQCVYIFTYCVYSLHIVSRYLSKRYIHI